MMVQAYENAPHAHRRAAREGPEWDFSKDLPSAFLQQFFENWREIEAQIEAFQDHKKTMLAKVRSRYGRHQAEALKITMRLMLTDPVKRAEQRHANSTAYHYLDILEAELDGRTFDA